jgi:hypothetical protein
MWSPVGYGPTVMPIVKREQIIQLPEDTGSTNKCAGLLDDTKPGFPDSFESPFPPTTSRLYCPVLNITLNGCNGGKLFQNSEHFEFVEVEVKVKQKIHKPSKGFANRSAFTLCCLCETLCAILASTPVAHQTLTLNSAANTSMERSTLIDLTSLYHNLWRSDCNKRSVSLCSP